MNQVGWLGMIAVLTVFLAACAPVTDVSVFSTARPPYAGDVAIFTDRENLPENHAEIGQVVVRDQGESTISEQMLLDAVIEEAAAIGANAVLISRENREAGGTYVYGTYIASNERVLYGLALWLA